MTNPNGKIEKYIARDDSGRSVAHMTIWLRRKLNENSGRREWIRQIVGVDGADTGSSKIWTRGKRITASNRVHGLALGLSWEPL